MALYHRKEVVSYPLRMKGKELQVKGSCLYFPFLFFAGFLALLSCLSLRPLKPPNFNYPKLAEHYFRTKLKSHFPITLQRELNLYPTISRNGYLFYTSNVSGSGDIWMRDLKNTSNFPIVKHPAEQYKASVNATGERMVFVSEDRDEDGDLRFLSLEPEAMSKQHLRGFAPPNLWDKSINLSDSIREWSKKNLGKECHGNFSETDPELSAKGELLLFVSERCSPGLPNLWLAKLDDEELLSLQQLTQLGGSAPRFAPPPYENRIVFLSHREQRKGGALYLLALDSIEPKEVRLILPEGGENAFLYSSPDFLGRADTLVYTSIRKDTNQDGILSVEDHAGIYSLSLPSLSSLREKKGAKLEEKEILENSSVLHGISYSNLLGGAVFYSASFYNSINIYFIPARGIVPKERNIEEQYQLSLRYLAENEKRYLMAQKAVLDYHKDDPKYAYYEAQVLIDSFKYYAKKNDLRSLRQLREGVKRGLASTSKAGKKNPYIALYYGIYARKQKEPNSLLPYLKELKKSLADTKEAKPLLPLLQHKLAEEYLRLRKFPEALREIKELNSTYLDYPFRRDSLYFEAQMEWEKDPASFPLSFNTRAQEIKEGKTKALELEDIHKKIYEFYGENPRANDLKKQEEEASLGPRPRALPRSFPDSNLEPIVQKSIQLLEARKYAKKGEFKKSLSLALQVQAKIPKYKAAFRYAPEKGYSGLYTNSWRLIERCYRRLGKQLASFSALVETVSSYSKASKIELDTVRIREFIDFTKRQSEGYLGVARSIAEKYRSYKKEESSKKGNEYLEFVTGSFASAGRSIGKRLGITSQKEERIELEALQTAELGRLCNDFSQNNIIFQRLSSKYARLYTSFCEKNGELLKQEGQSRLLVKEARKAIDLLYGIAYSNIKILNFLFFNIRRLGLLDELYKESSIYFRRLEVDIIAERAKNLFHDLQKNVILDLLIGERGNYKKENFSEIEYDYRLLFKQAILAHDLSMIYAYAYLLIQKNTSEEAFYKSLETIGEDFSSSFLQDRKKESIHELKNAEYLLRYILNVDPQHADAYLLLGWLLQYIDQSKKALVRYRANPLERLFGKKYSEEQDKEFYEDIYDIYFPSNYYEENVELYHQALSRIERIEDSPSIRGKLGHLHLNLANNYFILNNFREARRHYAKVLSAFETSEAEFESEKQRVLFYFNFARSLIYEGNYEEALVYLKKCYSFYEEKEYLPLKENHKRLRFTLSSKARQSLPPDLLTQNFSRFQSIETQLKKTRARLALISALMGLTYWETAKAKEALFYYHRADSHLYEEKPELDEVISRANLLNFMAMAYQNRGELENADHYAKIAAQEAQEAGLKRGEERYKAKGYCGKSMGCLLNFGEDFSVVGKGRNPYGFSPLRQYELALSIQLENMIARDEFGSAADLIQKQRKVFYKHEKDLKHGQRGYLNTLNREALSYYKAGEYQRAAAAFQKAAEKAHDFSNMESYRINYANYFNSLLSSLEYDSPHPGRALSMIEDALEEWDNFEEVYREEIQKKFISEKRAEFYAYKFDEERDGAALEERTQEGLAYMTALKASFLYYEAHFRGQGQEEISFAKEEKREGIRQKAINILKGLLEEIEEEEDSLRAFSISCRYNLARLYFASGELYSARDVLESALRDAYEFHLFREEILLSLLASQLHEELYALYKAPEDEEASFYYMENLLELFFSNPHRYVKLRREADKIKKAAAAFYIRHKEEEQALKILEQSYLLYLDWQYFRYRVAFVDEAPRKIHASIREKRELHREIDERKYLLRLERKNTKSLEEEGKKLKRERQKLRASLRRLSPKHRAFLLRGSWKKRVRAPSLSKGQLLLRFFAAPGSLPSLWCFSPRKKGRGIAFFSASPSLSFRTREGDYEAPVSSLMKRCLERQRPVSDIFIIPTEELASLDFYQIIKEINPQLPPPTFATRVSQEFLGRASPKKRIQTAHPLRIFNAGTPAPVLAPYSKPSLQEGKGKIGGNHLAGLWKLRGRLSQEGKGFHAGKSQGARQGLRELLEEHPYLSLLLLKRGEQRHSWKEVGLLYEILRSYGLGTLAWEKKEGAINIESLQKGAGRGDYARKGLWILGFPGFVGSAIRIEEQVRKKYRTFSSRGEEAEQKKDYQRAKKEQLLAASYLAWHPEAPRLSSKQALTLLRLDILLAHRASLAYQKTMQELLALPLKNEDMKKEFERAVYKTAIEAMSESRMPSEVSQKYIEEYQKRFPKEAIQLSAKARVFRFLSRLNGNRYNLGGKVRRNFKNDFSRLHPYLKEQRDLRIIEKLIKHSQYDSALRLAADWKKEGDKSFQKELGDLELTALLARFFLQGRPLDLSLPVFSSSSLKQRSPYLQMLCSSLRGKWKEYARLSKQLQSLASSEARKENPLENPLENSLGPLYLYAQWKNFLKQDELNLSYIDKIQGNENENFLIQFLEQSLIYHLLVHSLESDSANQNSLFLDTFIKENGQKFSLNYMAETALYASKKYLEGGDFFRSLHFFDLYLKAEEGSIFEKQRSDLGARIGTCLDALGLRPGFVKYHERWKKSIEGRGEYGNFVLNLFQGLSHGNMRKKIEHLEAQILVFSEMQRTQAFPKGEGKGRPLEGSKDRSKDFP